MLSPTLNSEYLTSVDGVPSDWLSDIAPALDSLKVAYSVVAGARGDFMDDVTKTEPARLLNLNTIWDGHVAPRALGVTKALEALSELPAVLAKEREAVFPVPTDQASIVVASEVRSALAKLSDKERRAVLVDAVERGDRTIMAAVVNAPTFLTSVSQATADSFREQFIDRHHPEMKQRRDAAERLVARVEQVKAALGEMRSTMFSAGEDHAIMRAAQSAMKAQRHLN